MKLPDNVDPKEVFDSTGVFGRNPSNMGLRQQANDQEEFVKSVIGSGRKVDRTIIQYSEPGEHPFPGMTKIRSLTPEVLAALFKNIMRFRPNTFKVHIKLGNYPSAKPTRDGKVFQVGGNRLRYASDIGESIAEVFADDRLNIVELVYQITNGEPGNFLATCEAAGTTKEEYENDEFFDPAILIEYYPNEM